MTWGRRLTLGGLIVGGIALAYVEMRALRSKEPGDTISAVVAEAAARYPIILTGMIAPIVHFGTPTREAEERLPWWQGVWTAIVVGIGVGWVWPRYDRRIV